MGMSNLTFLSSGPVSKSRPAVVTKQVRRLFRGAEKNLENLLGSLSDPSSSLGLFEVTSNMILPIFRIRSS